MRAGEYVKCGAFFFGGGVRFKYVYVIYFLDGLPWCWFPRLLIPWIGVLLDPLFTSPKTIFLRLDIHNVLTNSNTMGIEILEYSEYQTFLSRRSD